MKRVILPRLYTVLILALFGFLALPSVSFASDAPAPIATSEVVDVRVTAEQRDEVISALQRDEVQNELERQGVDPDQVVERVERMNDAEIAQLHGQLDELPAGGSSLVSAAVFVFVVLLVTDLLGLTDVFPFTR